MIDDSLLTVKEAAYILKIHPYTVYGLLKTGRLIGFQLNRRWRIRRKNLEALMDGATGRQKQKLERK